MFELVIRIKTKQQLKEIHTAAYQRIELLMSVYETLVKKKAPTGEIEQLVAVWDGLPTEGERSLFGQIREEMERYKLLEEEERTLPKAWRALREKTLDLFEEEGVSVGGVQLSILSDPVAPEEEGDADTAESARLAAVR